MTATVTMEAGGQPPASIIDIRGLTKRFGATLALDSVDIHLRRGEIHALLGENGAGKSTLIKILTGVHLPDAGETTWKGDQVDLSVDRLDISVIHQDHGLVDSMTVGENVALAAGFARRRGLISWSGVRDRARHALDAVGCDASCDQLVERLSASERALVAIARALLVDADVLILDEPTASLPESDAERLFTSLDQLRRQGVAILYVTHRLDEVFRISDWVTVLRDGRVVESTATAETTPEGLVVAIVGHAVDSSRAGASNGETANPVVEFKDVTTGGAGPVTLRLGRGEILGLVGLTGAGQHEMGRALVGDEPVTGGAMELYGQPFSPKAPADAVSAGVGFVSGRRTTEGIAPTMTVRENVFPTSSAGTSLARRFTRPRREHASCLDYLHLVDARPRDPERVVATLSGGNQQKVILARWFAAGSRVLVLEDPTAGIDVGAREDIYSVLEEHAAEGNSVLLVSTDFSEVAAVCHRALVFNRGRLVAELTRPEISTHVLTELASQVAPTTDRRRHA